VLPACLLQPCPPTPFTRTPAFVGLVSAAACFVTMLVIRPPFILRRGDRFARALVPALLWSLLVGALVVGIPTVIAKRAG